MVDTEAIERRCKALKPVLDERMRRIVAAAESLALGYGGASIVSRATGVSRRAIAAGVMELTMPATKRSPERLTERGIRRRGGGRKRTAETDPTLKQDLGRLVDPVTRGDPESPLRWTCKSVRKLAEQLNGKGHQASHRMVAELLHELGYSLQANRKSLEGSHHPDRDAQFQHISQKVQQYLAAGQPVISVDTKKKELVGDFKNGGRELQPKGRPERVRVHDFEIPALGKVAPYGVYDIGSNAAWVSVGIDHDTSTFAVESIRRWWHMMGHLTCRKRSTC
jgi:transposase